MKSKDKALSGPDEAKPKPTKAGAPKASSPKASSPKASTAKGRLVKSKDGREAVFSDDQADEAKRFAELDEGEHLQ